MCLYHSTGLPPGKNLGAACQVWGVLSRIINGPRRQWDDIFKALSEEKWPTEDSTCYCSLKVGGENIFAGKQKLAGLITGATAHKEGYTCSSGNEMMLIIKAT